MTMSRLSNVKQDRLMEHFVAGTTARCAATLGVSRKTALSVYRTHWGIETLYSTLKTRGQGLEKMHITASRKLVTLMSVLAIAICLAYKPGLWLDRIKPPRHKSHGWLQRSLFALGLNAFRKAMVKMTGPEIVGCMRELFEPKFPRKALIGLV